RGRGSVPRTVRALLPERDVARAPRRTTTVPRGGDRAGSVLGGLAEPRRLRPAARVGPRVVDGHGPSPRRRRRAPRGVPAPPDGGVTALGPRDPARPGRGRRRRDRTPGGTPGRPRRPRRSPRRTASGDRAHVLRRPVAIEDLRQARAAAPARAVFDPARDETSPHRDRRAATMMRSHERIEELIEMRSIGGGPAQAAGAV